MSISQRPAPKARSTETKPGFRCGWCSTNQHDRCKAAVRRDEDTVWLCRCEDVSHADRPVACTECKRADEGVDPTSWRCIDRHECELRVLARREADPFYKTIVAPRIERDAAQAEATRLARSVQARRNFGHLPPKAKSNGHGPAPTGSCQCGCGASTKSKFAVGHDAKHASALIKLIRAGDQAAMDEIVARGWTKKLPADLRST